MVTTTSSSDVNAPKLNSESISDEGSVCGFLLALGAGGRKEKPPRHIPRKHPMETLGGFKSLTAHHLQTRSVPGLAQPAPLLTVGCSGAANNASLR